MTAARLCLMAALFAPAIAAAAPSPDLEVAPTAELAAETPALSQPANIAPPVADPPAAQTSAASPTDSPDEKPGTLRPDDPHSTAEPVPLSDTAALQARVAELEARVEQLEVASAPMPPITPVSPLNLEQLESLDLPINDVPLKRGAVVAAGERVPEVVGIGGPVDVYGTVEGDAVSLGGDVRVMPGGSVLGNTVSLGGTIYVHPDGQVMGDQVALGGDGRVLSGAATSITDDAGDLLREVARRIALLLSLAGVGVLVAGLWPRHVDQVAHTLGKHPIWYSLAGAILTAMLSLGAAVTALSLVGIPVSVLLICLLAIGWLLGFVAVCTAIGRRFGGMKNRSASATFLAGAAVITAIAFLPWVGGVFLALVGFPAVGAALLSRLGNQADPGGFAQ